MAHKTVGDADLPFTKVVNVMKNAPTFEELFNKWRSLIPLLDCSNDLTNRIDLEINLKSPSYWTTSIVTDILKDWRLKHGQNAKLGWLIQSLESIHLRDISQVLKIEFRENSNIKDEKTEVIPEEPGKAITEYMEYYLVDLLEATELSPELLKDLAEQGVLSDDEVCALGRMRNQEDENKMFYQFVIKGIAEFPEKFDAMIKVFLTKSFVRVNYVGNLLSQYYDERDEKE